MIDVIQKYWEIIAGSVLVIIFTGRSIQKTRDLDRRVSIIELDYVNGQQCNRRHTDCKAHNTDKFNVGSQEFSDLKNMIKENEQKEQHRHDDLVKMIVDLAKGQKQ